MVDYNRLSKIKTAVDLVLSYDLEKLRNEDEVRKLQLWNEIKNSEKIFEQEIIPDLPQDVRDDMSSQFSFAELRLAVAEQGDKEQMGISHNFNEEELSIVPIYDKYNLFDVSSAADLAERMQHRKDIYNLALEYLKEYSKLDALLDSPKIRKDIKLHLKKRNKERIEKVNEGIQAFIGKYGLDQAVKQIEKSVLDIIKQSEEQRKTIEDENRRSVEELSNKLKALPEIENEAKVLRDNIDELESIVSKGEAVQTINSLDLKKDDLARKYASLEKELADRVGVIEKRNRELEIREAELEKNRQEYRQQLQEEKQRLVEGELKEIAAVKEQLAAQATTLQNEKQGLEVKRQEIVDRLRQLNEIAEGKSIRYISSEDARLCEMNFLARFDTKMQSYPVRFYSPLEKKEFEKHSWKQGEHISISESSAPDNPWNVQDRYIVSEKKHGFFGEKIKKVIIEAISFNHLDEFEKFKFDSRCANLADFLNIITRIVDKAEVGNYLHVIGIASPTGWDEKVKNEVQSTTFAHNYISRFVSFCLVDSVTGEVFFNPADDRISKFIEYFTPEFNREKIEKVRQYILQKLAVKNYVVFDDAFTELGESRGIINKVFYDLQREDKGKVKYMKEVGLVIQTPKL
jgi:hypothetical protein